MFHALLAEPGQMGGITPMFPTVGKLSNRPRNRTIFVGNLQITARAGANLTIRTGFGRPAASRLGPQALISTAGVQRRGEEVRREEDGNGEDEEISS